MSTNGRPSAARSATWIWADAEEKKKHIQLDFQETAKVTMTIILAMN